MATRLDGRQLANELEQRLQAVIAAHLAEAGQRVIVLEDTSTTGGSPLAAIEALLKVGAEVAAVAVVVDRNTGARERIEADGYPYLAALGLEDLGLD